MNYKLRIKKINNNACPAKPWRSGGYTIIETMIAVSLFIIIVIIGMGALLNANLIHQKSQNMRSIIDNLSFTMEDMSRTLRIGEKYYCISVAEINDNDLSGIGVAKSGSGCAGIAFKPFASSNQWVYEIVTGNNGLTYYIRKSTDNGVTWVRLTSDEIVIDPISSFSITGAEPPPGDNKQPFVTIKLVGKIIYKNVVSPFSLQTSVSQRVIDI